MQPPHTHWHLSYSFHCKRWCSCAALMLGSLIYYTKHWNYRKRFTDPRVKDGDDSEKQKKSEGARKRKEEGKVSSKVRPVRGRETSPWPYQVAPTIRSSVPFQGSKGRNPWWSWTPVLCRKQRIVCWSLPSASILGREIGGTSRGTN